MLTTEKNPNRNNKKEKKRIPTTRKSSQQKWGNSIEVVTENHKKIIYMHAQDNNQNKRQTEKKQNYTISIIWTSLWVRKKMILKVKLKWLDFLRLRKKTHIDCVENFVQWQASATSFLYSVTIHEQDRKIIIQKDFVESIPVQSAAQKCWIRFEYECLKYNRNVSFSVSKSWSASWTIDFHSSINFFFWFP